MSMQLFGYHGRYLRVDLTQRAFASIELPSAVLAEYIGGTGLASWILRREFPGSADALDAEAPLIFCFSSLSEVR